MHVDVCTMPRAPRLHKGPVARPGPQPNFMYTGDQFIFTRPPERTVICPMSEPSALWAWLSRLFG